METWKINDKILDFEEETHTYYVDGVPVHSVTQLLSKKFPNKYSDIPKDVLQKAAERGTQVHKAIECYCHGFDDGSLEVDDFKFLQKHYKFSVEQNELPMILTLNGKTYAGRADMLIMLNDELSVADIKTTSTVDKEYLGHQLNLYKLGIEESYGYKIKGLYGIHLRDGKRKLIKIPIVSEIDLIESLEGV